MKSYYDIKTELGITNSNTIGDLITLSESYRVFTQTEINQIKAISVMPLPTTVRNQAEELKKRFTNIVLDEDKGSVHAINVRNVLLLEIISRLNTGKLAADGSNSRGATDEIIVNKLMANLFYENGKDKDNKTVYTSVKETLDGKLAKDGSNMRGTTDKVTLNELDADTLKYKSGAEYKNVATEIEAKANASDVYPKTETYTKNQTDVLLSGKANNSNAVMNGTKLTLMRANDDKAVTNVEYVQQQITNAMKEHIVEYWFEINGGKLYLKQKKNDGTIMSKDIELPTYNVLSSVDFDETTMVLTLTFANGQSITKDLSALIDTYSVDNNGNNVVLTLEGNTFSANLSSALSQQINSAIATAETFNANMTTITNVANLVTNNYQLGGHKLTQNADGTYMLEIKSI